MTDYAVIRSGRRTMALQVGRDGAVCVRAPYAASEDEICRFVTAHKAWIERARQRQAERTALHPEPTEQQRAELIKQAKAQLPPRVTYWSERMGLSPTEVKITSAKTRFGSCSGKNSLCFSWRLMDYPSEAIDLVIVHELCHIRYHNHGKGFYRLLSSVLPDYKERMALLK